MSPRGDLYYRVDIEHMTVRCRLCAKRIDDTELGKRAHARVHVRSGMAKKVVVPGGPPYYVPVTDGGTE